MELVGGGVGPDTDVAVGLNAHLLRSYVAAIIVGSIHTNPESQIFTSPGKLIKSRKNVGCSPWGIVTRAVEGGIKRE